MSASSPSTSTQWHAITPQTRPLSLSILELTPLALTLSLTLASPSPPLPAGVAGVAPGSNNAGLHPHSPSHVHVAHTHNHAHGPKHRKKRHRRPESDDELTAVEPDESDHSGAHAHAHPSHGSPLPGSYPFSDPGQSFKDLLSHGVVVSVNGQPWSRIVAHVSDDETAPAEEAEEHEEEDWEDEYEHAGADPAAGGELEEGEEGVTRRRPRRARFGSSAHNATRNEGQGTGKKKKEVIPREGKDRAVVVVYGLSPGKEYEIELRVVGVSGQDDALALSNSVLIPPSPSPNSGLHPRSRANSLRSRSRPRSRSNSINAAHHPIVPSSPLSHLGAHDAALLPGRITPPMGNGAADILPVAVPTPILSPADSQAAQMRHMIAVAHAEKEHLTGQIKEARRASQRAEAALRVEIETVKKAIEKAGTMDLRAKQKALALQEQVKQGWAGAESAEKEIIAVDEMMSELENKLEGATIEVQEVHAEWKAVRDREEGVKEQDRKARSEEDKKLVEMAGKLDKLKAKKERKEAENAELELRLEELEKKREEAGRRGDEEKNRRSGYWQGSHWEGYHHEGPGPAHRGLTTHPSLSNLGGSAGTGYSGPGFRPRQGFQPRYASAGSVRPPGGSQPSPTHPNAFYPVQHPQPPTTSPAFRPPKASPGVGTRAASGGSGSATGGPGGPGSQAGGGAGTNPGAAPFHPGGFYDSPSHHTTSLMPPSLQHRIYLPNVRPRPAPTFHPPPSVLEQREAAAAATAKSTSSPTTLSAPSFPPLPGQQTGNSKNVSVPAGPSLASIVTRAVLSPTSAALATQGITAGGGGGPTRMSPPPGAGLTQSPTYPAQSPVSPTAPTHSHSHGSTPTPPLPTASAASGASGGAGATRVSFAPPPSNSSSGEFSPLSPTGPWAALRWRHRRGGMVGGVPVVARGRPRAQYMVMAKDTGRGKGQGMGKGRDRDTPARTGRNERRNEANRKKRACE
ncbi:hypothetical protein EHS25_008837 [Saitozyma podzolica]|uniref:Uncharacterized protein n=1 Tax=Saitozyma podzolica TaxID=1890683 RepID=A0A427YMS1_9TREE|nr:hypothetical protein EHS25_008837 [Saitozyma podzolica]